MKVLVIDNFAGSDLGLIGDALAEAGASLDRRAAYAGAALPSSSDQHDALIVLGGAQSALDDAEHPYLPDAARLAVAFGQAGKAVLGVCLGSQLIARGFGGRNWLGRPIEFGWHRVEPTPSGASDLMLGTLGVGLPLFHWHQDTFDLPPGAVHLATSQQTAHQAFRIGARVYGIQFHFEASTALVARWSDAYAAQIAGHTPDWPQIHPRRAAEVGAAADRAGLDLARAWVRLAAEA